MESASEVKKERKVSRPPRGAARQPKHPPGHSHPFEVRHKAVQLCLEEGFPVPQVAREMEVGRSTLSKWMRMYRDQGESETQSKPILRNAPHSKVAPAVKEQAVKLKQNHPD